MISWINSWAQQIIVSVIIATLIEMILPNGNIKKYIKTVIGIYVLLVILLPVVSKFTNDQFDVKTFDYEDYIKNDTIYNTMSSNLSNEIDTNIEQTYITSLKQDIKTKINQKGFVINEIEVGVILDENSSEYGSVSYVIMSVSKKIEENNNETNSTKNILVNQINNVSIGENIQKTFKKANNITASEERQIMDFLNEEYGVKKENITIT